MPLQRVSDKAVLASLHTPEAYFLAGTLSTPSECSRLVSMDPQDEMLSAWTAPLLYRVAQGNMQAMLLVSNGEAMRGCAILQLCCGKVQTCIVLDKANMLSKRRLTWPIGPMGMRANTASMVRSSVTFSTCARCLPHCMKDHVCG